MKYLFITSLSLIILTACATSQSKNKPQDANQAIQEDTGPHPKPRHIPFPYLIDRDTFIKRVNKPRHDNTIKPFTPLKPLQFPKTPETILKILDDPSFSP